MHVNWRGYYAYIATETGGQGRLKNTYEKIHITLCTCNRCARPGWRPYYTLYTPARWKICLLLSYVATVNHNDGSAYRVGRHVDDHVNEQDDFLFVGPEQVALVASRRHVQSTQVRRGRSHGGRLNAATIANAML